MTLWQAVIELDSTFANIGKTTDQYGKVIKPWLKIPDQRLLVRAIMYATH